MREVKYELENAITRVRLLLGRHIQIKVNKGRNKFINFNGRITNAYVGIFTILGDDSTTYSFSYNDVVAGNVKFYSTLKEA